MRRDSSDMGFNQPFGQNQQRNRHQEARVCGKVMQEGDSHVVPDRQALRRGEHEERDPGQEQRKCRSPGEVERLWRDQTQPLLKPVRGACRDQGELRA
jgi:hypothetical protein